MIRRAAAVVLALTLNPALVRAQDIVFTVNVPSADVYKGPSNVTPVIGHVSSGTVLPVSRNLGSWIKVPWPKGPDGFGFVHVTMGRLTPAGANSRVASPSSSSTSQSTAGSTTPQTPAPPARTSASRPVVTHHRSNLTPAEHNLGVGGLIGTMSTYGANARMWPTTHIAIQFGLTRDALTSTAGDSRMTSVQFEPGVMYGFFDHVSDYVWLRPYVGSTVSFRHQTLKPTSPSDVEPVSDNGLGFRFFGGTELMFASAPRFGVSADLGYRRYPTPFAGFEIDPLSMTIAGHWYIR